MKSGSIVLEYLLASGLGIVILLGLLKLLQCIVFVIFQAYTMSYLLDQGRWLSLYFNHMSYPLSNSNDMAKIKFHILNSTEAKDQWGIKTYHKTAVLVVDSLEKNKVERKTAYYIRRSNSAVNRLPINVLYRKTFMHRAEPLVNHILDFRIKKLYCLNTIPSYRKKLCGIELGFLLGTNVYYRNQIKRLKGIKNQWLTQWWPVILCNHHMMEQVRKIV